MELAPDVCDRASETAKRETTEAKVAVTKTAESTKVSRRISPPPGNASCVGGYSTHISIPMQLLREEIFRIFAEESRFGNIGALKGGRKRAGSAPYRALPARAGGDWRLF